MIYRSESTLLSIEFLSLGSSNLADRGPRNFSRREREGRKAKVDLSDLCVRLSIRSTLTIPQSIFVQMQQADSRPISIYFGWGFAALCSFVAIQLV